MSSRAFGWLRPDSEFLHFFHCNAFVLAILFPIDGWLYFGTTGLIVGLLAWFVFGTIFRCRC